MRELDIIPAIDLIGGKCVRLTQGDYSRLKVYGDDPVEVACAFRNAGATRLHLVDLEGAKASAPVNLDVLGRIKAVTDLTIEFGGGIKTRESLSAVLDSGADYAICGSVAVTDPGTFSSWLEEYPGKIIISLDLRDGLVATRGWLDTSAVPAREVLERFRGRVDQAIVTRIECDGMLGGIDTGFYKSLQEDFPEIGIIVSGGVSTLEDLMDCENAGLRAAIVGKAFYEGRIDPAEVFRGGNGTC